MSTHYTHLRLEGSRLAVLYRFDVPGDGLPEHMHGPDMTHDVSCTRGRVMVYGPGLEWVMPLKLGERAVFDSTSPHEIMALEPKSSVVNEYYQGIPANYAQLPEDEKDGTADLAPQIKLRVSEGLI